MIIAVAAGYTLLGCITNIVRVNMISAPGQTTLMQIDISNAPIICPTETVQEDWIDYNRHLNMAFYHVIFDHAVDYIYDHLGIGEAYTRSGAGSCFIMEVHVHYLQELSLHDEVQVHFQLLDFDDKRLHFFAQLYHVDEGYLAATSEQLGMHIDMQSRRAAPFPEQVRNKLVALQRHHAALPVPRQVGHIMAVKHK